MCNNWWSELLPKLSLRKFLSEGAQVWKWSNNHRYLWYDALQIQWNTWPACAKEISINNKKSGPFRVHHPCQVDRKIGLLIIPHDKWKLGKDYLASSPAEMGGSRRIPAISSSFLVLLVGWLAAGWPIKVRMLIRPRRCGYNYYYCCSQGSENLFRPFLTNL